MIPADILGWTGSVLVVVSLTQSSLWRLRSINLAASIVHLVFNVALGIVPMIALNVVLTGVNAYYLIRQSGIRSKPKPRRSSRLHHNSELSSASVAG